MFIGLFHELAERRVIPPVGRLALEGYSMLRLDQQEDRQGSCPRDLALSQHQR
jgi:hypothetical protein